jgi:16S rRNA (adenine1518-N6/adenine1519-N6)-dimethyltransferase
MAIDIDRDLIGLLTERFSDKPYVSVVRHDATRLSTLRELFEVRKPIVVVGNLPFGSSTKILFEVLDLELSVKKAVLMFQKEVARRLTASPPGRIYGALTVACKARARVDHLFDVSAGSFHPRPDVDGSVVAFTPRLAEGLGRCCLEPLSHILKAGFGARRKTVRNALKKGGMWQEVGDLDAMAEIDASRVRPEAVAPAVYYSLARQLCEKRGEHQRVRGLSR